MKDSQGFLWIGTADGLNRYDGKNFVHFYHSITTNNSIPDNDVHALMQFENGMIWIGTFNGICTLNPLNNEITRLNFPDYLRSTEIISSVVIKENPFDKSIWIATNKGLFTVDQKKNTIVEVNLSEPSLKSQFITAIQIQSKDILWLGCYQGLIRFDRRSGKAELFQPPTSTSYHQTLVSSIIIDDSLIWIGTWGRGLQSFDPIKKLFTRYLPRPELGERSDANIVHFVHKSNLPGEGQIIWSGSETTLAFNKQTKQFTSYGISGSKSPPVGETNSFCNGKDEGMWIGSMNGLYRRDPHHQLFTHVDLNVDNSKPCLADVFSVYADPIDSTGNTLLVSTWTCGTFVVNHTSVKPFPSWMQQSTLDGSFKDFYRDKSGLLWATSIGCALNSFDEKNHRSKTYYLPSTFKFARGSIGNILEDAKGNFWLSSFNGLFYFDRKRDSIIPVFYEEYKTDVALSADIRSIAFDKQGNLWFCTNLGLNKKSAVGKIETGSIKPTLYYHDEKDKNSFPESSPIESIVVDKNNIVWCASWNGVLYWNASDPQPKYHRLTRENGLCNDKVLEIKTDAANRIWMATLMGMSCYDPATSRFRNFFSAQGLHQDEVAELFSNNITGELIAGYRGGIDILNPSLVAKESNPPATIITNLKIFNEPYAQNKKFFIDKGMARLSHAQNMLTFSFSALSFTDPSQLRYAYKMEGVDKDWIISQNDFATYHDLSPGKRKFFVKACNAEGIWNDEGTWMEVDISPPFYRAWWFITVVAILIVAGIYAIYTERINRLKEKFRIRSTIARDLHDEIGSTLTSINILSRVSYSNLEKDRSHASDLLQKITEQSESMQQSMSDIIWAIKPENDKLRNMAIRMREYLSHTLESRNITIRFIADERVLEESLNMEQRRDFFLIFKEAVNNAAKYSQSPVLEVEIKKTANEIMLRIRDEGKGFIMNGTGSSNGLKNMRARASALHGTINIDSMPGRGTTVVLVLPAT